MMIFCTCGTWHAGISTPRSPLATITPSAASMMLSMFCTPSAFSILAMISIRSPPFATRNSRISLIASAFRIKEAATKSISCSIPKRRSPLSFSVRFGRLIETFGTFTPFFSPSSPPFTTVQTISGAFTFSTRRPIRPSSIRIVSPSLISSVRPV